MWLEVISLYYMTRYSFVKWRTVAWEDGLQFPMGTLHICLHHHVQNGSDVLSALCEYSVFSLKVPATESRLRIGKTLYVPSPCKSMTWCLERGAAQHFIFTSLVSVIVTETVFCELPSKRSTETKECWVWKYRNVKQQHSPGNSDQHVFLHPYQPTATCVHNMRVWCVV
jgi:hypothetical protein